MLVPMTPEWLKPHLEHGFSNLKELGLDRRETKILQEEFLKLSPKLEIERPFNKKVESS